jgi:hypothetical protein
MNERKSYRTNTRACNIRGCLKRRAAGDDICTMHRARIERHGDASIRLTVNQSEARQTLERWVADRDRSTGCWEWPNRTKEGYADIIVNGRRTPAGRYALLLDGRDPTGFLACHHCDNPPCVNPDHLYVGTHAQNVADSIARGRSRVGEASPRAKITEADVREIRRMYASGVNFSKLGAAFSISKQHAARIARRENWAHVA